MKVFYTVQCTKEERKEIRLLVLKNCEGKERTAETLLRILNSLSFKGENNE